MRSFLIVISIIAFISGCTGNKKTVVSFNFDEPRNTILFDKDWRFYRGDSTGLESVDFDDSSWRTLDLPHDWSIEDIPGTDSPIDSTAAGGLDAGYLVGGTSWYRKSFYMPGNIDGKKFMIQFDGVYMNADVWLNDTHLGFHPYGYTTFRFDITDHLVAGEKNTIAVRVRNEGHNSRWYSGSGIYRHVWLTMTSPARLDPWWTFVNATVQVDSASINISSTAFNNSNDEGEFVLVSRILDKSGENIASSETVQTVSADSQSDFKNIINIGSPELWSTESPVLYTAVNELWQVSSGGSRKLTDRVETPFGIRSVEINNTDGFVLNGKPVELKGGCMHHDNGPLGAAAFDRAEERRVELMKEAGFNAIRCSHNPPSPAFLDACDRLGMMVIDESFDMWAEQKNPEDYHLYFNEWWQNDVESMVRRDRNHPSIIMWSIGNEVPERGKPEGARLAKLQADFIRQLDTTRKITSAVNSLDPDKDPYFAELDVAGYNYAVSNYIPDHKRLPERIILSTESFALEAFEYWMGAKDNPWVIGDFVWTGFDYLGEASIGWLGYPHDKSFFPWTHAFCGDIDICGFKRPQSFYRDVLWKDNTQLSVFVKPPVPSFPLNPDKAEWSKWEWQDVVQHWNWQGYEGKTLEVEVYSSCEEVELFLNNVSLGRNKTNRSTEFIARWNVPFTEGTLSAKGFNGNKEVALNELHTTGKASAIKLTADRQSLKGNGQDLCYIIVELTDPSGNRDPLSNDQVNFEIEGTGYIQAVGSSNPMGTESFVQPRRKAYQGRCLVIVRSGETPGEITLKASAAGMGSSEIIINVL